MIRVIGFLLCAGAMLAPYGVWAGAISVTTVSGTFVNGDKVSGTTASIGTLGAGLSNFSGVSVTSNRTSVTTLYASGNVGIGVTAPTEKLELPSGGNIKMGYEVVNASFNTSGGVNCSAGKQVVGGGCNCVGAGGNYVRYSAPNGAGWYCYCDAGTGDVAYAVCANIK